MAEELRNTDKIYKIGQKLIAYKYDSIGYYRGEDNGDTPLVEIIHIIERHGKKIYIVKYVEDENKVAYLANYELFEENEELPS
jgi:hypothetical protein